MNDPAAVLPSRRAWPLHGVVASRQVEQAALALAPPHALMLRAGLGLARLACALAPHAASVWIAAGPGNNGGDGLVAARLLHLAGRRVRVGLMADPQHLPPDAAQAWRDAVDAGVPIDLARAEPDLSTPAPELAIDALLGLGAARAPQAVIADAITALNRLSCPVLAVDLPSGLSTDTGQPLGKVVVRASHTLALLTLKPGLFTAQGRDFAGQVWLDTLDLALDTAAASAGLAGPPTLRTRLHAQHKGSFGDVTVLGGAPGMGGAALLAARAALLAGAGRVFLARLDDHPLALDAVQPELMPRTQADVLRPERLAAGTLVCGCGGGDAVAACLPQALAHAARLVLDADALNAVASDAALARALARRAKAGLASVLTPHPLEAARLLGLDTATVQADRLAAAHALAQRFGCTVLLKGSGSVVAAPGRLPVINPTGNADLGCAGTGDVLAGWLGGFWASQFASAGPSAGPPAGPSANPADTAGAAFDPAVASAWLHGAAADADGLWWPRSAGHLPEAMARLTAQVQAENQATPVT